MSTGDKVRFVLRGLGQTLITLGLVVLLFVVYEVWITNLFSERANNNLATKIKQEWQTDTVDPLLPLPNGKDPKLKLGTGIGNIFIPRLGRDYHFAIVEGTNQDDLAIGPGHYQGTALPGAVGNFAVAGHRVGKGEPFLNVDKLRPGDAVIVETKSCWYVYRVKGTEHGLTQRRRRRHPRPRDRHAVARSGAAARAEPPGRAAARAVDDDDDLPPEVHGVAPHDHLLGVPVEGAGQRHVDAGRGLGAVQRGEVLMYVWIWRHLPGPLALRIAQVLLLVAAVSALLLFVVFPWIEPHLPISQVTVPSEMTRVLVVDNYDSFVYNLVQYLGQLGADVLVRRNDAVHPADLDELDVDGVLISPGPGMPQDAGESMAFVSECAERALPLFGVCLGHQAIGAVFGAPVLRAPELLHGKTSEVEHDGSGVLAGLPTPFTATRYHSLAVEEDALPAEIVVTGRTPSGVVMALRHESLPIEGVQFHPESVLTQGGHRMVANWLRSVRGRGRRRAGRDARGRGRDDARGGLRRRVSPSASLSPAPPWPRPSSAA